MNLPGSSIKFGFPVSPSCLFFIWILVAVSSHPAFGQKTNEREKITRVEYTDEGPTDQWKRATSLREQGHYDGAYEIYQTLLGRDKNDVIRVSSRRGRGTTELIYSRISQWPESVRRQIAREHRGTAMSEVESPRNAGSRGALRSAARMYFFTEPGRKAAHTLAEQLYREGYFMGAADWWDRLLRYRTHSTERSLELLLKIGACYRSGGRKEAWHDVRSQIDAHLNQVGKQLAKNIRNKLDSIHSLPASTRHDGNPYEWPPPGETVTTSGTIPDTLYRTSFQTGNARTGHHDLLAWFHPGNRPGITRWPPGSDSRTYHGKPSLSRFDTYRYPPVQPVVADQKLFMNDGEKVLAFHIDSSDSAAGPPLSKREGTVAWIAPEKQPKMNDKSISETSLRHSYQKGLGPRSVEVSGESVYFWTNHFLYRVSIKSGNVQFRSSPPSRLESDLAFNGVPRAVGQNLYVPTVLDRPSGRQEHVLACYDSKEGNLKWRTRIGTGRVDIRSDQSLSDRRFSYLVPAGHQIIYQTNQGLIASINAYSGHITWARRTDDRRSDQSAKTYHTNYRLRGRTPPAIQRNRVFVLPAVSHVLEEFDITTGERQSSHIHAGPANVAGTAKWDGNRFLIVKSRSGKSDRSATISYRLLQEGHKNHLEVSRNISLSSVPDDILPTQNGLLVLTDKDIRWYSHGSDQPLYLQKSQKWASDGIPRKLVRGQNRLLIIGPGRIFAYTGSRRLRSLFQTYRSGTKNVDGTVENVFALLLRNGEWNRTYRWINKLLASEHTFLSGERVEKLRNLRLRAGTKRIKQAVSNESWKIVKTYGKTIRSDAGRETYLNLFWNQERAGIRTQDASFLTNLYTEVMDRFSDSYLELSDRRGRTTHRLAVEPFIRSRLRAIGNRNFHFSEKIRHRLPAVSAGSYSGSPFPLQQLPFISESKRAPWSNSYVFQSLRYGYRAPLPSSLRHLDPILSGLRVNNRPGLQVQIARKLSREYPDQTYIFEGDEKSGEEMARQIQEDVKRRHGRTGDVPDASEVHDAWMDSSPLELSPENNSTDQKHITIPLLSDRTFRPIQPHPPYTAFFSGGKTGLIRLYNPVSQKMTQTLPIRNLIQEGEGPHYIVAHRQPGGALSVIVNNLSRWECRIFIFRTGKKGNNFRQPLLQKTIPDRLITEVAAGDRALFIKGYRPGYAGDTTGFHNLHEWALQNHGTTVVESYAPDTNQPKWSRKLYGTDRISLLQAGASSGSPVFFVTHGSTPGEPDRENPGTPRNKTTGQTEKASFASLRAGTTDRQPSSEITGENPRLISLAPLTGAVQHIYQLSSTKHLQISPSGHITFIHLKQEGPRLQIIDPTGSTEERKMAPFPDIEGQDMDYNLRYAEDYLYVLSGEMGKTGDNGTGPSSEMSVWKGLQVNRYPVTSRGAPGSRQHTWGIDDSHNIFQKGPDKFLFMPAPSPDTSYLAVPRDPDESSFNQPRILRVKRGKSGTIHSTWENVLPISRSLDRITLFHGIATGKKGLLIVRGGIAGSSGDVQNVHLSLHPFTANGTVPWTWYHHRYRVPSWRTLPYSRSENPFSLQIPFIGGPFPGSFQLNGHLFGRSPERSDS